MLYSAARSRPRSSRRRSAACSAEAPAIAIATRRRASSASCPRPPRRCSRGASTWSPARFCEQPTMRHVGGTKDPDVAAIVALAPDPGGDGSRGEPSGGRRGASCGSRARCVTHVTSLADVTPTLVALARATGVASAADMVRAASAYDVAAGAVPVAGGDRCRVAVLIWRRPWMALGAATYGSSVLRHLGLHNVPAGRRRLSRAELAVLAERRPDLVVLPSEPYPFAERARPRGDRGCPGRRRRARRRARPVLVGCTHTRRARSAQWGVAAVEMRCGGARSSGSGTPSRPSAGSARACAAAATPADGQLARWTTVARCARSGRERRARL
ncbi:MAG: helical backbone metal receptor [Ilumatobacteraceae bacterium]